MADVFLSYAAADSALALRLAAALESAGYRTWCYETDGVPGSSYLLQTSRAIEDARALVVLVSNAAMASLQITREIVRAYESGRTMLPVMVGVTYADMAARQPEWRQAFGAVVAAQLSPGDVDALVPSVIAGLRSAGIEPGPVDPLRIARLGHRAGSAGPPTGPPTGRPDSRRRRLIGLGALAAVAVSLAVVTMRAPPQVGAPVYVRVVAVRYDDHERQTLVDALTLYLRGALASAAPLGKLAIVAPMEVVCLGLEGPPCARAQANAASALRLVTSIDGPSDAITIRVVAVDPAGVQRFDVATSGVRQDRMFEEAAVRVGAALGLKVTALGDGPASVDAMLLLTRSLRGTFVPDDTVASRPGGSALGMATEWSPATALAGEITPEIGLLLRGYRDAIEGGNLDRLRELQPGMSASQAEATRRYLANARGLEVEVSDLEVESIHDRALVRFTRTDRLRWRRSGTRIALRVGGSIEMTRRNDRWIIVTQNEGRSRVAASGTTPTTTTTVQTSSPNVTVPIDGTANTSRPVKPRVSDDTGAAPSYNYLWSPGEVPWADRSSVIEMTIVDHAGRARERRFVQFERREQDGRFAKVIFFTAPAEVRDLAFLSRTGGGRPVEQWLYLPMLKRMRVLGSQVRGESFLGSDLTYEDVDILDSMPWWTDADVDVATERDDVLDGVPVRVVEFIPKRDDITYGAIELTREAGSGHPRGLILISPTSEIVKDIEFSANRVNDVPERLTITSPSKGTRTILRRVGIHILGASESFPPELFTAGALERGLPDGYD